MWLGSPGSPTSTWRMPSLGVTSAGRGLGVGVLRAVCRHSSPQRRTVTSRAKTRIDPHSFRTDSRDSSFGSRAREGRGLGTNSPRVTSEPGSGLLPCARRYRALPLPSPVKVSCLSFPQSLGRICGVGGFGVSGARGFLPFSGDFKTPPRPRPKGEARPRGWKCPSVGACGSPAVMTPRVLAPGFTGAGRRLGLLQPLLRTTQCQLGGDLPLGKGHPDRGAPGGFLGPIQATTVHPIVSAGAGAAASDVSSNPLHRSEPQFTPPWNGHKDSPYRPG